MRNAVNSGGPSADELEFRFVSGHRALDLAATFGARYREGVERLREPADLDRWLRATGLAASTSAQGGDLAHARELREVIYRIARAELYHESIDREDVHTLNAWARSPRLAPQLDSGLQRTWVAPRPVRAALALIACEAVELLTGPDCELIRECGAAPECSLLYIDRSRGHRRRWCEMERCGSRAKMAAYRKRRAGE